MRVCLTRQYVVHLDQYTDTELTGAEGDIVYYRNPSYLLEWRTIETIEHTGNFGPMLRKS